MTDSTGTGNEAGPTFQVSAHLDVTAPIEFLGVFNRVDGPPVGKIRLFGVPFEFTQLSQADDFAAAAQTMAAQLHVAHERNKVRAARRNVA